MKRAYYFVLIVLILLIFAGLIIFFKYYHASGDYDSTYQLGCEKLGGKWDYIGLDTEKECNLPTSDIGNVCYDRSDCEGECIADLTSEETKIVLEKPILKSGKCSEYRVVAGCRYFVENGNVSGLLCVD